MLTQNLTVTDNGNAAKPGIQGAKVFNLVANLANGSTKRRIAATAMTTPEELSIGHTVTGSGFKQRCRTVVRSDLTLNNTDTTTTGGVIPSSSVYVVIDRPTNISAITAALLKNQVGQVIDTLCVSGQLDSILNQES